jgi:hypothetical protein
MQSYREHNFPHVVAARGSGQPVRRYLMRKVLTCYMEGGVASVGDWDTHPMQAAPRQGVVHSNKEPLGQLHGTHEIVGRK